MRRSGCAVKMISPASCVVGVYYVPTPRDGGYLPPEEGITDGYPRPLHTPPSMEGLTSKPTLQL